MPSPLAPLWLMGYFECEVEDEHATEFMKQIPSAEPFLLHKCPRTNQTSQDESAGEVVRVSSPFCLKPREISKCRHHRAFFNFLTLNDFIRKWMRTLSVCMRKAGRMEILEHFFFIFFLLFAKCYPPPPYLNEAANKSLMPRAKSWETTKRQK